MSGKKFCSINRQRVRKAVFWSLAVTAAGILYLLFVSLTGISIPCVIHGVTGYFCPGCGMSRMFLRISKADFSGAFYANRFLFSTLLLLLCAAVFLIYRYITEKPLKKKSWFVGFVILYAAAFLAFGVLRNIDKFSFLAPR